MRTRFIRCRARKTAVKRAPWAEKVSKVVGGYVAFESEEDYRIWKKATASGKEVLLAYETLTDSAVWVLDHEWTPNGHF